jgi:hypothetical protein
MPWRPSTRRDYVGSDVRGYQSRSTGVAINARTFPRGVTILDPKPACHAMQAVDLLARHPMTYCTRSVRWESWAHTIPDDASPIARKICCARCGVYLSSWSS